MSSQPVALDILFLLGRDAQDGQTGLHVNAIYKKLVAVGYSKNKKRIITIIDYLEESKLLTTEMRGAQKEIKTLTPLGYEFVKLADDIDGYVASCYELQELIKNILDMENSGDKKVQRNILRSKGWTTAEIDESDEIFHWCQKIADLVSPYEIITVVFTRYISLISKISDIEDAKTLLNHIMVDKINDLFANITARPKYGLGYNGLLAQKEAFITTILQAHYHSNRFTDEKVKNFLSSVFCVLHEDWDRLPAGAKGQELLKLDNPVLKEIARKLRPRVELFPK